MRSLIQIVGAVVMILGIFFALQGAGVVMWPADSFMLANGSWIGKGLVIAIAGAAVILIGRRVGTKA